VLLTGPARAGTTLTCELLNRLPDTVALDEPLFGWQLTGSRRPSAIRKVLRRLGVKSAQRRVGSSRADGGPTGSRARAIATIDEFVAGTRTSLRERGVAVSKNVGGQVLGAKIADNQAGSDGLRRRLAKRGEIRVDKDLPPDFVLVVKQNSGFTALLDELTPRYRVFAVIRSPLTVLCSWQTVPFAVHDGHAGIAETIDPGLRQTLAGESDPLERQLRLLSWFFRRYQEALSESAVVRYEDIVATGGAVLSGITASAATLDAELTDRNRASVYPPEMIRALGTRLLERDGAYWHFYSRDSVSELIEHAGTGGAR
jgi:hypothetical protein